jgi:DNA (cytosine-5)-methyltransferase 1
MLTSRGLGTVLGDLASMGFDAKWGVLGAKDVGANHQRDRIWIFARNMAYSSEIRLCSKKAKQRMERRLGFAECGMDKNWWNTEPSNVPRIHQRNMDGMADGVASRVDRLKAIGNGQVPLCAATAWKLLNN